MDFTGQGEEESKGKLRHGLGILSPAIADLNSPPCRFSHVNMIVARSIGDDSLETGGLFENQGIDPDVFRNDDPDGQLAADLLGQVNVIPGMGPGISAKLGNLGKVRIVHKKPIGKNHRCRGYLRILHVVPQTPLLPTLKTFGNYQKG